MVSKEVYEEFLKKYNAGEVVISVVLYRTRQTLTDIEYSPLERFYAIIYLLLLGCCIYSFFALKWLGILYSIVFIFICFRFIGIASLPKQQSNIGNIFWTGIVFTIISYWIFNISIAILIAFSFLEIFLILYLYRFCAKVIINKFILVDINFFNILHNDVFL